MANNRSKLGSPKHRQNQTKPRDQGKRRQGVKKSKAQVPTRRSARLNPGPSDPSMQPQNQPTPPLPTKRPRAPVGSTNTRPGGISQDQAQPTSSHTSNTPFSKRKRDQEIPCSSLTVLDSVSSKRPRTLAQGMENGQQQEAEKHTSKAIANPVQNWVLNRTWPPEYFESDNQTREELLEHDTWLDERLGSSETGSSDQKSRESRGTLYQDPRYPTLLAAKGIFLHDFGDDDPPTTVTDLGQNLLNAEQEQAMPQNSLFHDDIFRRLCREIADRNKAMIIQDISRLLVPSAKNLALYGDRHLDILIENVNESWTESVPVWTGSVLAWTGSVTEVGPRPQPDYAVGFGRSAFTKEQLNRLDPLLGSVYDTSFFVATFRMYFPFLTCEVKCSAIPLNIADRQNAHSMTLAVRAVVELFRLVGREAEIDREMLAFSISHNHQYVRIYGYYAIINGKDTTFYRHLIHDFSFVAQDGKERWTAYKFTKNVYNIWMPTHLERLCSAIDQLPLGLDFDVAPLPQHLSAGSVSQTGNENRLGDGDITLNTSPTRQESPKRPRRKEVRYN